MWRRTSVLVTASVILTSPVTAATMRNFAVGSWFAGAYSSDVTHQFDHCAASASYKSGISVYFAIGRNFTWSMGFSHPAWHLQRGAVFDVAFTVDSMAPLSAKATAISSNLVEVDLVDSAELFARFRRGYLLQVAAANQIFSFSLTGTSQLLPALLTCAQNRGAEVRMASNPFESKSSSPASPVADEATATAEATALAANLLSSAGIQGFTLLGPGDFPDIKGNARWVEGSTFGTINVYARATADELNNLPAYLIGADAKSCKGTFFSGAVPDDGTGTLARVFTTCQTKGEAEKPITVYYLAVPRKAGGAYVISTVSFGSEKPAKEADAALRSVVFKVLVHSTAPAQN